MGYTREDCMRDTQEHIAQVQEIMLGVAQELIDRAWKHDRSKMREPEIDAFTEYTPKLRDTTYGSDEYKSHLAGLGEALKHHYSENRHHPEHHKAGIRDMDLVDLVEMFCDWKAATMRHADGDLERSIKINKERFGYSDDLEAILLNSKRRGL